MIATTTHPRISCIPSGSGRFTKFPSLGACIPAPVIADDSQGGDRGQGVRGVKMQIVWPDIQPDVLILKWPQYPVWASNTYCGLCSDPCHAYSFHLPRSSCFRCNLPKISASSCPQGICFRRDAGAWHEGWEGRVEILESGPWRLLAHASFAGYPIIPLAKALHLLVQSRIAQKLFHFRARLAGSGTSRGFPPAPTPAPPPGRHCSWPPAGLQHHKHPFQHDNWAGKGPTPAWRSGWERPREGNQSYPCRRWPPGNHPVARESGHGGKSLVDGPAKIGAAIQIEAGGVPRARVKGNHGHMAAHFRGVAAARRPRSRTCPVPRR